MLVLALPALSGCVSFDELFNTRPDLAVSRTPLVEGWNRDGLFRVEVEEQKAYDVRIVAKSNLGAPTREMEGASSAEVGPVEMTLPDGDWDVTYYVDGHRWERFRGVRIDTQPPSITYLESVATATAGSYLLGARAEIEDGSTLRVLSQDNNGLIATELPVQLTGLGNGVHGYTLVATDAAGNQAVATVQVRSGSAALLPEGKFSLGLVARYTNELEVWDLARLDRYLSPAQAAIRAPAWLGDGNGITPQEPAVQNVVAQVVTADMSTGEAALALYRWMFDNLDYNEERLNMTDLLSPAGTIGAGGGICRDLAALYTSLLRGAGIPARLVTGYLGPPVDGFHAWVEFYGADSTLDPSPWVPVDISPIDGPYLENVMLQSFAIRLPGYLALRALSPSAEQADWSTAVSVRYSFTGKQPDVQLEKAVTTAFADRGVLCIDKMLGRKPLNTAQPAKDCPAASDRWIPNMVLRSETIIDYGLQIVSAPAGSEVTVVLAYPDSEENVRDGAEEFVTYGAVFERDPATGMATAQVRTGR